MMTASAFAGGFCHEKHMAKQHKTVTCVTPNRAFQIAEHPLNRLATDELRLQMQHTHEHQHLSITT